MASGLLQRVRGANKAQPAQLAQARETLKAQAPRRTLCLPRVSPAASSACCSSADGCILTRPDVFRPLGSLCITQPSALPTFDLVRGLARSKNGTPCRTHVECRAHASTG